MGKIKKRVKKNILDILDKDLGSSRSDVIVQGKTEEAVTSSSDEIIEYKGRIFPKKIAPWYTPHISEEGFDESTGANLELMTEDMAEEPEDLIEEIEEAESEVENYYESDSPCIDIDINKVCDSILLLCELAKQLDKIKYKQTGRHRKESIISEIPENDISEALEGTALLCEQIFMNHAAYSPHALTRLVDSLNKLAEFPSYMKPFKESYFNYIFRHAQYAASVKSSVSGPYLDALNKIIELNDTIVGVVLKEKVNIYKNIKDEVDNLQKRRKL